MVAEFPIAGSGLPNWDNPSKNGRIIERAMKRLDVLRKEGKVKYSSGPGWCHFILNKNGKQKMASYKDHIIEKRDGFYCIASLTFTK